MSRLAGYVRSYFSSIHWFSFLFISLVLTVLTIVNYKNNLYSFILSGSSFSDRFLRASALFYPVFAGTYLLNFLLQRKQIPADKFFHLLLVLTPIIFAAKVSLATTDVFYTDDNYIKVAMQWPLKALFVLICLLVIGYALKYPRPLFGTGLKNANLLPYFGLLALMVPLLLAAGTGADFQKVYPKLHLVSSVHNTPYQLLKAVLFELCYGIDFFTIELFFRGFAVLAFIKYVDKDTILPMAVFYCTIHFGKPVAECISSYFGGLILGAIVYNTRSIWGGLVVHLGIAWMMEVIGIIF